MKKTEHMTCGTRRALWIFGAASVIWFAIGCAPEPVERKFEIPRVSIGPRLEEPELVLSEAGRNSTIDPSSLRLSGETDSAKLFRISENLIRLGRLKQKPSLINFGRRIADVFYSSDGTSQRYSFIASPYVSAATGESEESARESISEAMQLLTDQEELAMSILDQVAQDYRWPERGTHVNALLDSAKGYLTSFLRALDDERVDVRIQEALDTTLNQDIFPRIETAKGELAHIFAEQDPSVLLRRFRDLIDSNGIELSAESLDMIHEAEAIMKKAKEIDDDARALRVLVRIWELLEPENRKLHIREASKPLYDYLKERSRSDLDCLKSTSCKNPIIWTAKKLVLYPELNRYGVQRLRKEILESGRLGAIREIEEQAADLLPSLPDIVAEKFRAETLSLRISLEAIDKDFKSFMGRVASDFSLKELGGSGDTILLRGFEESRVNVEISSRHGIRVDPVRTRTGVTTGAEVIGASLSLAEARWNVENETTKEQRVDLMKRVIENVNKLLVIGGFKSDSGELFSSMAVGLGIDDHRKHLDLRDFLTRDVSFGVPDKVQVGPDHSSLASPDYSVGVRGQAEILRGMSAMVRFFRDWEKSGFDEWMGKYKVGDYIRELPRGAVEENLFPKEMLFSLSLGNAAVILSNITRSLTPVFLLDIEGQSIWADRYDFDEGRPATMAALVDILAGLRMTKVESGEIARFTVALVDFLEATEGVEATKASPLLEMGEDGKTALETLVEARQKLRLLAIAFSNFLSHKMQGDDGGIYTQYIRTTGEVGTDIPRKLIDQVLCIQALTRAGEYLDVKVYKWTALDILAYMNRSLWRPEFGFYSAMEDSKKRVDLEVLTATLLAGEALTPFMSERSLRQWANISQPWVEALENFE